jgi:hypothetical protein
MLESVSRHSPSSASEVFQTHVIPAEAAHFLIRRERSPRRINRYGAAESRELFRDIDVVPSREKVRSESLCLSLHQLHEMVPGSALAALAWPG